MGENDAKIGMKLCNVKIIKNEYSEINMSKKLSNVKTKS